MPGHVRRAGGCGVSQQERRWRLRADVLTGECQLHLVLLGDSIFDNAAYTGRDPDVVTHLRGILPGGWRASLLATDGAVCDDVPGQTRQLPRDATHLALSVGGNDVLRHIDLLDSPAESTAHALDLFGRRVDGFETAYERALDTVVLHRLPVIVCTIYNGALRNADEARRARLALTMFNDVIARAAWQRGCDLLDLRLVCSDAADYANPIEPSGRGGAKIARALARGAGALPEREPCLYTPHCTPV